MLESVTVYSPSVEIQEGFSCDFSPALLATSRNDNHFSPEPGVHSPGVGVSCVARSQSSRRVRLASTSRAVVLFDVRTGGAASETIGVRSLPTYEVLRCPV